MATFSPEKLGFIPVDEDYHALSATELDVLTPDLYMFTWELVSMAMAMGWVQKIDSLEDLVGFLSYSDEEDIQRVKIDYKRKVGDSRVKIVFTIRLISRPYLEVPDLSGDISFSYHADIYGEKPTGYWSVTLNYLRESRIPFLDSASMCINKGDEEDSLIMRVGVNGSLHASFGDDLLTDGVRVGKGTLRKVTERGISDKIFSNLTEDNLIELAKWIAAGGQHGDRFEDIQRSVNRVLTRKV